VSSKYILGRKEGMTQIFDSEGNQIPVTVIEAGPCRVIQVKSTDTDGYDAVQLGFREQKPQRVSKPLKGHFKKAGVAPVKIVSEFRCDEPAGHEVGDTLTVETFAEGDFVDVVGKSKGRGFTGVMKRWGFHGGPASHGAMFDRRVGAIGMHSDPSRVFKGKKMPGHYGDARITVKGLKVVGVDVERNLLLVRGAVPGARNGLLKIRLSKSKVSKAPKV